MNPERICQILRNDDVIRQKLSSLIDSGIKENKEYGLNICLDDRVSMTDTCTGTECEIELKKNCSKETKEVISFHVHTDQRLPSGKDYITTARFKEKNLCVGYKYYKTNQLYSQKLISKISEKNMVNCYKVPDSVRKLIEDFELIYNEYSSTKEKHPEDKKKLIDTATKLNATYDKIKKIEVIDEKEALGYAKRNKLCDIAVSPKPIIKK